MYAALRPYLHEFLEAVSLKYELVIYTAAEVRDLTSIENSFKVIIVLNIILCHTEIIRRQMYQPV